MTKTLLERAKEVKVRRAYGVPITEELKELIIAFLKEEIRWTQAMRVLGLNENHATSFYQRFFRVIKELYKEGRIKIIE